MRLRHRLIGCAVTVLVAAASGGTSVPVGAQIVPGQVYTGGQLVQDPTSGLAVTVPVGWRGALAPDGSAFLLEPEAGQGLIVIRAEPATEAEARAVLTQPVPLGNGVVITPSGEIEEIGRGHMTTAYTVSGTPGDFVSTVDVRMTDTGLGVGFVLLSPAGAHADQLQDLRALALSLGVTEPTPTPTTGGNDEWEPWLRGAYLARFYSGSGYTESTELWLCSDGSFYMDDQSGGYGGGASGAFQTTNGGRWSATGSGATGTLILNWSNGQQSTWDLEFDYEQRRTYVNGNRWLRGENERCG